MYTIRPADHKTITPIKLSRIVGTLQSVLKRDGRFTCQLEPTRGMIQVRTVRLTKGKPYCGNHPGPCQGAQRKLRNMKYLEGEDWIAFHNIVNDVLDEMQVSADVWAKADTDTSSGRIWMRKKDLGRRWYYDWRAGDSQPPFGGRVHYVWNHGTPDQFRFDITRD
jgi:hypothetical protein